MVLEMAYLVLAALWLGSMVYSLAVVQPRIVRFFADDNEREMFLLMLAHGNRWPVVALITALAVSAGAVIASATGAVAVGYVVALAFDAVAAIIFVNVSWRHWPARIFAMPGELPGYRRRLSVQARAMTVLVGAGYLIALAVSVR
jgi:hypothetical protein